MALNYFICTLGQASRHKNKPTNFTNIPNFIQQQAQDYGNHPAVGYYDTTCQPWTTRVLNFNEVLQGVCVFAEKLSKNVPVPAKQTVALLCPSSANLLFTWLGLMSLGHPVLLIAPQCSPTAVVKLCEQCECSTIIYDEIYAELANSSQAEHKNLNLITLPFKDGEIFPSTANMPKSIPRSQDSKSDDIAYLHHTSGTSSGIPKPIPQTHYAGAGVYANLSNSSHQATFTTTPLYHGGIADLFRAWTSHALIWLFPGKEVPITAKNVVKCLEVSDRVEFLSCVPYVLEMLADDAKGMEELRKMSLVGVGGAALPASVGDKLVHEDVKLVSRFGSAECGFLSSSNRDFEKDGEWQYLRVDENEDKLRFESREDGLSELVILSGWPHMSKINREDGSFATSDLFQPHPRIKSAWKYHSRADSQLTLVTGKKFDPSPLESAINASSPMLSDVLIFGNGKPYPGILLFRSQAAKDMSDSQVLQTVGPKVEELNKESQGHARLSRNMLLPMPWTERPLEKSSKGTILRGKAEERYATNIAAAYQQASSSTPDVPDEEIANIILDTVSSVMNASSEPLEQDTDLFAYGIDSIACIRIRQSLSQLLPKGNEHHLPLTIVQDSGTISNLSKHILAIRKGRNPTVEKEQDINETMLQLVKEYSTFTLLPRRQKRAKTKKTVLLTGSSGSLGSHLLSQLLTHPEIGHIHLLLRGSTIHAAHERVVKALASRKLAIPSDFDDQVSIHPCHSSKPNLGLPSSIYTLLAQEVDIIYHLAWTVDFNLPLHGFRQHFAGLQSLLDLHAPTFIFCSSTASLSTPSQPEDIIADPRACSSPIGYSRSKWVAENILAQYHTHAPHTNLSVVRAGQLSGDSVTGIWNMSEAIPMILSTAISTSCLPDLGDRMDMSWVPVDVAAKAFVDLVRPLAQDGLGVYHVVNPNTKTSWTEFCYWGSQENQDVEIVAAKEWLAKLEGLRDEEREHPALKLLDFWKEAYGSPKDNKATPEYELTKTCAAMPTVSSMDPIDKDYALKLWQWTQRSV